VDERIPLVTTIHADNAGYLLTKAQRMDHIIDIDALRLQTTSRRNGQH
jgi:hypothetical protein